MSLTLYRRPMPEGAVPFASDEGRALFAEALARGGLDGYFRLAEQFHTQSDPSFCGLGSLVVALNALAIDPGRLWKGPWRWFAEELLDCCVSLDGVRARGLTLDELACLARCNGADVSLVRADTCDVSAFRAAVQQSCRGGAVLIAAYDRATLGQTGSGHYSPIGGYHPDRDLVLILDVARFKYPPHWVALEQLHRALLPRDPATGRARGYLQLTRSKRTMSVGFSLRCDDIDLGRLVQRRSEVERELARTADLTSAAQTLAALARHVEQRTPEVADHARALASARAELRLMPLFATVRAAVEEPHAEVAALLLLASRALLPDAVRAQLPDVLPAALTSEIAQLADQLDALRTYGEASSCPRAQQPAP